MHHPVRLAMLAMLALCTIPVVVHAQDTNAEEANRALTKSFESAWNTRNVVR